MRLRKALPLALAPFFAACRPQSQPLTPRDPNAREAVLLTAHDLAPGRQCRIVDPDAPLPDVATIIDTTAVPEYLRQASIPASDTGYALFSLRYDSTGTPVRARLIEATTPDSIADALRAVIASAVVQRPAGTPIAARLRIDFTPALSYRVGKSEYCDPRQIVVRSVQGSQTAVVPRGPSSSLNIVRLDYEADISATGTVLAIRFTSSNDPEFEASVRQSMMQRRWEPALDDGAAVAGRGTGSMRLEMRLEGRTVSRP